MLSFRTVIEPGKLQNTGLENADSPLRFSWVILQAGMKQYWKE